MTLHLCQHFSLQASTLLSNMAIRMTNILRLQTNADMVPEEIFFQCYLPKMSALAPFISSLTQH